MRKRKNKIVQISVDMAEDGEEYDVDIVFRFDGSSEEFVATEFRKGTKTKKLLQSYEDGIIKLIHKLGIES